MANLRANTSQLLSMDFMRANSSNDKEIGTRVAALIDDPSSATLSALLSSILIEDDAPAFVDSPVSAIWGVVGIKSDSATDAFIMTAGNSTEYIADANIGDTIMVEELQVKQGSYSEIDSIAGGITWNAARFAHQVHAPDEPFKIAMKLLQYAQNLVQIAVSRELANRTMRVAMILGTRGYEREAERNVQSGPQAFANCLGKWNSNRASLLNKIDSCAQRLGPQPKFLLTTSTHGDVDVRAHPAYTMVTNNGKRHNALENVKSVSYNGKGVGQDPSSKANVAGYNTIRANMDGQPSHLRAVPNRLLHLGVPPQNKNDPRIHNISLGGYTIITPKCDKLANGSSVFDPMRFCLKLPFLCGWREVHAMRLLEDSNHLEHGMFYESEDSWLHDKSFAGQINPVYYDTTQMANYLYSATTSLNMLYRKETDLFLGEFDNFMLDNDLDVTQTNQALAAIGLVVDVNAGNLIVHRVTENDDPADMLQKIAPVLETFGIEDFFSWFADTSNARQMRDVVLYALIPIKSPTMWRSMISQRVLPFFSVFAGYKMDLTVASLILTIKNALLTELHNLQFHGEKDPNVVGAKHFTTVQATFRFVWGPVERIVVIPYATIHSVDQFGPQSLIKEMVTLQPQTMERPPFLFINTREPSAFGVFLHGSMRDAKNTEHNSSRFSMAEFDKVKNFQALSTFSTWDAQERTEVRDFHAFEEFMNGTPTVFWRLSTDGFREDDKDPGAMPWGETTPRILHNLNGGGAANDEQFALSSGTWKPDNYPTGGV